MDAVLFHDTSWGGDAHIPIIRGVAKAGYTPIIKDYRPDKSYLGRLLDDGVECLDWDEFVSDSMRTAAQRESANRIERLLKMLEDTESRQPFSSPSGNFLTKRAHIFFKALMDRMSDQMLNLDTLSAIVERHELHLIVLGYDFLDHSRSVIAWARERKIATLGLSQFFGGHHPEVLDPLAKKRNGEMPLLVEELPNGIPAVYADFTAVEGQLAAERLERWGAERDTLFVTGSVKADPWYPIVDVAEDERVVYRDRLGLRTEAPAILACLPFSHERVNVYSIAARYAKAYREALLKTNIDTGAQLILAPEPAELRNLRWPVEQLRDLYAMYVAELRAQGIEDVIVLQSPMDDALKASTLAIAPAHSSILPRLMIAGLPVIASLIHREQHMLYEPDSGVLLAEEPTEIPEIVAGLLKDAARLENIRERQFAYLHRVNFNHDGKARERLGHLILKLARRKGDYKAFQWELEMRALEKKASYEDLIEKKLASLVIETD